mgnify:CR=1 FL=1
MSRVLIISLGCLVAATTLVARADVYQCTRNGQVTFSDIPCSSDAKPLPLNIYTPSPEEVERATRQTREIEENLASGQKQRQIDALRAEMEAKKQQMNREIAGERNEQTATTTETSRILIRDLPNSTRPLLSERSLFVTMPHFMTLSAAMAAGAAIPTVKLAAMTMLNSFFISTYLREKNAGEIAPKMLRNLGA